MAAWIGIIERLQRARSGRWSASTRRATVAFWTMAQADAEVMSAGGGEVSGCDPALQRGDVGRGGRGSGAGAGGPWKAGT
jgi:hypothetical protein